MFILYRSVFWGVGLDRCSEELHCGIDLGDRSVFWGVGLDRCSVELHCGIDLGDEC